MKVDWTPSGGSLAHLGDDSATPRMAIVVESFGGAAVEQVEKLFRAGNAVRFPRGNVAGEIVFTVLKSHSSYAVAFSYMAQEYNRLNQQGNLVFTEPGTHTLTFANAILKGVERAAWEGVKLVVRYRFGITTVAYA